MKAPHYLAVIILLAGSLWGVRESRHLSVIRVQHQQLIDEAKALGLPADSSQRFHPLRSIKRARVDNGRNIDEIASKLAEFARHTREIENSGDIPDEGTQRRMIELLDEILSLKSDELQQLIGTIKKRTDMDDEMRSNIVGFSIIMLAQSHPQSALAIFSESSDLLGEKFMASHVLSTALTQWAKDQPFAAMDWIKKNEETHPELAKDDARLAIIAGAAQKDFRLAFQLSADIGTSDNYYELVDRIASSANTPERQLEFLAALREQAASMTDNKESEKLLVPGFNSLFNKLAASGYDKGMEWIKSAGLTDDEMVKLSRSIDYYETERDTGKWLDWISARHDVTASNLMRDWTRNDFKAAGQWLADSPAGPAKETATIAYLEAVAPYDPNVAVQWAQTLPGAKSSEAMKKILKAVASKDSAAGKAFAEQHGLEWKDE